MAGLQSLFQKAVEAIDAGDITSLQKLLAQDPALTVMRSHSPPEGYFSHPYLLWFIAGNPVRQERLAVNICEITKLIIREVKQHAAESFREQIDYTLGLVATGSVPRESGVQIELMDILINEGATVSNVIGALAHGNKGAAQHLVNKGAELTLAVAICLEISSQIPLLAKESTIADRQLALMASSFYGIPEMIQLLISDGDDVNFYLQKESGFHSHATALHQAVFSGSLEAVKILAGAGADLTLTDKIYNGTALGWAKHMEAEETDEFKKRKYTEIVTFLSTQTPI